MRPLPGVRSQTARSLDRALVAVAAFAALIVLVEVALLLRAGAHPVALVILPAGFAVYVAAGLVAWQRRPSNPMGALMVWTGTAVLFAGFGNTDVPVLDAVGAVTATLALAALIHLVLAFPTGRLDARAARATVTTGYLIATVLQAPAYLLDPRGASPSLAFADLPTVVTATRAAQTIAGGLVTVAAIVILADRLRRADRGHRRMLVPFLGYAIFAIAYTPASAALRTVVVIDPFASAVAQFVVVCALPIVFVIGILRGGFPRTGDLDELGTWLGEAPPSADRLTDVLVRALGDPSARHFVWSEERGVLVDADGMPAGGLDDPRRGWVDISVDGATAGAIGYDAELLPEPSLVAAAGRVVAIAVERERLAADLRATRAAVAESRELLMSAAARDRRRVARELRAGQQDDGRVGHVLTRLITDVDAFLDDLERVAGGEAALDPDLIAVMTRRASRDESSLGALTPRQKQVLALVADGRSNASIAAELFLTEKAVVQHVSRIYDALGLPPDAESHRRVQAVVLYLTAH